MEQSRGPYERPLLETLGLMAGNIQLNTRQYLVNHIVLAPILIWAGHTPVRQADAPRLPASVRYLIWGAELALLLLALLAGDTRPVGRLHAGYQPEFSRRGAVPHGGPRDHRRGRTLHHARPAAGRHVRRSRASPSSRACAARRTQSHSVAVLASGTLPGIRNVFRVWRQPKFCSRSGTNCAIGC